MSHMAQKIPEAGPSPARLTLATRFSGLTSRIDIARHTLVFTHIPKTGGTTLDHIVRAVSAVLRKQGKRLRFARDGAVPRKERNQQLLNLDSLSDEELASYDYLSGHFPFGIHRRLPRPALYVALLRDPVTRLLSQVRFGLDHSKWPRDTSVTALIEQGRLIDNLQTRQIAGIADRDMPCTTATLATALENLRSHYAVVGITERFDAMLKTLITLMAWPDIAYSNRQISVAASDPELEARVRLAAERHFALDMELYAAALARPAPWSQDVLGGTMTGNARQNHVLVASPLISFDDRPFALLPAAYFDARVCPDIRRQGGDVQIV